MTFTKATGNLKNTDVVIIYGQTYSHAEFLYCGSLGGMTKDFANDMQKRHVIACWLFDGAINFLVSDFPNRSFNSQRRYEAFKEVNLSLIRREKNKTY